MKKQLSPALQGFLLSGTGGDPRQFSLADCLTIVLYNGSTFRFTSWDYDVFIGTRRFFSMGTRFKRGQIQNQRGVQTQQLAINLMPDNLPDLSGGALSSTNPPQNVGALSLTQALIAGLLNGAQVTLETVYNPVRQPDGTFTDNGWGSLIKFTGVVADASSTRASIDLNVASQLHQLEPMWPPRVFQLQCPWRLFDQNCKLNADAFAVNGSVTSTSTQSKIFHSLTQPSGYFSLGRLVFTTGPNAGISREIKTALGSAGASYAQVVANDTPRIWLKLANASDSSGNGFSVTTHGGVSFAQSSLMAGDSGNAALFDGSTGFLTVNTPAPARFGTGVTFEFWLSLASGAAADQPSGVFDTGPHASASPAIANLCNNYSARDAPPAFDWNIDKPIVSFQPPTPGVATHFVVVYRGARSIDLYINGALFASETDSGRALLGWTTLNIGRSILPHVPTRFFNGTMQHFAFYEYPFDSNKAVTHFTAGTTAPIGGGAGVFNMMHPFPFTSNVGDQFTVFPGCDKSQQTCVATFHNEINFGGTPFVPAPEVGL